MIDPVYALFNHHLRTLGQTRPYEMERGIANCTIDVRQLLDDTIISDVLAIG